MHVELIKEYRFEAAHRLPHVPPTHKCSRLHGHSFRFELELAGEVDERKGWLLDFDEIDKLVKPMLEKLDHYYLNEIEGLENPTSEVIAFWIFDELHDDLPLLTCVTVFETCDARARYRRNPVPAVGVGAW